MCDKCDNLNSAIMKINDIIVLLYTLSHLYHYYSNPRVEGHHALLGTCHVMTLLYALLAFYSRYNKAPLITLLLQTEKKCIIALIMQ